MRFHRVSTQRCLSTSTALMSRTYADAIASLNTLQTNFAIIDAIKKSGRQKNVQAIPEMIEWCRKIGYEPAEFDRLNAIHIAGTKGKGSTAAFVSSIITQYLGQPSEIDGKKLSKVGLYTSPHLRFVRERIQINGEPLTQEQFTKYFFETWDRLEHAAEATGDDPKSAAAKPVYFRFLTLMAFHTYMSEGVDTAIMECGIGGAYDSTNVLQRPVVTGITTLGIDHVGVLGDTLPEIAWHKAGIMKSGSKCFTPSSQKSEAKTVLEEVSIKQKSELHFTDIVPKIQTGEIALGLQAEFQKTNASLAVAIAREWLTKRGYTPDEKQIMTGLEKTRWSGRCETRQEKNITWCIDGGHTLDSIEVAGRWFAGILKSRIQKENNRRVASEQPQPQPRILIFNQQTRDASALAKALYSTLESSMTPDTAAVISSPTPDGNTEPSSSSPPSSMFTHVIFCTNTTYRETGFRPDLVSLNSNASDVQELTVQKKLAQTWAEIDPSADIKVVRTIEEAVESVRRVAESSETEVISLVTGSLHLVGGFLEVFEGN